jgi:hypothetical protein
MKFKFFVRILCIILALLMVAGAITTIVWYLI